MKIGFIGTGDITKAIVTGLDRAQYDYEEIIVSRRNADVSAMLAATCARVRVREDNQEIVDSVDILVLAVRPQIAQSVLETLRFKPGQLVISLIATLTTEQLTEWTGPGVEIVRATPLPFVSAGIGVTPIYPPNAQAERLFDAIGRAVAVAGLAEFDALTASSTFMGTFFGLQEAIVTWLEAKGIAHDEARGYIASVFLGLAQTASRQADCDLSQLRRDHSTKAGLNEQMFEVFKAQGGLQAFLDGIDAVYDRIRRAQPSDQGDTE